MKEDNMKQGWEIKKIKDICYKESSNIAQNKIVELDGDYPVYGASGFIQNVDFYQRDTNYIGVVKDGSGVGRVNIYPAFSSLLGTLQYILPKNGFHINYVAYALKSLNLSKYASGAAIPHIYFKDYGEEVIPVPPLPVQEQIVSELDLLSDIIEKKRKQLKELDALAQSIFYDMFGDPITNEKGWEVKKLEQVSTLLNGRAYKQNELLDSGKYKVLRVGNFFTNSSYYYSDLELEEDKYCDNGDLLFAWSASFGAFIWNGGKVIYHYHIWKVLYDNKQLNIDYYRFLLNTMTTYFMKDVHGIGMVHLTKVGMEQYMLPIPPLPLQHQFASKIEAIERQKELIKQSISETETLFNARMQHYFG
jgi:type I restriction enzyme S subunit